MRNYGFLAFFILLVLAIAITLACGSPVSHIAPSCNSIPSAKNPAIPLSMMLCPAVADAQDFPDGQVQFIAIGSYTTAPSPAVPASPFWGACALNGSTGGVTFTTGGVAQCVPGSSGTFEVFASVPTLCLAITACGGGCQVSGYAKLTCP